MKHVLETFQPIGEISRNNRKQKEMKTNYPWVLAVNGIKLIGLVLTAGVILVQPLMAAGPAPIDLHSADGFTILAGAAITSTGGGTIDGDVGASPIAGSAIGIPAAQVNGIIYAVDGSGPAGSVVDPVLLSAAKSDLTTAYNDAAGRTPVPDGPFLNPNGGNIGGLNLAPGLYKFTSTAYITGSDVTLTGGADDVWIFQCASDLQLGSGIKVILAGGAQARNVFWQVGTSAVLGTSSVFKGTILADQAITMNTSSTIEGRALAFSAGVTFNGSSASLPTIGPVIKANRSTRNITINSPETLSVTVEMNAGDYVGTPVDWWVLLCAGSSWYYMDSVVGWTQEGAWRPVYQGGLFNLSATEVLNVSGLGIGLYTFYFAVDYPMDGILTENAIKVDSVNVTVQ